RRAHGPRLDRGGPVAGDRDVHERERVRMATAAAGGPGGDGCEHGIRGQRDDGAEQLLRVHVERLCDAAGEWASARTGRRQWRDRYGGRIPADTVVAKRELL